MHGTGLERVSSLTRPSVARVLERLELVRSIAGEGHYRPLAERALDD